MDLEFKFDPRPSTAHQCDIGGVIAGELLKGHAVMGKVIDFICKYYSGFMYVPKETILDVLKLMIDKGDVEVSQGKNNSVVISLNPDYEMNFTKIGGTD